MKYITGHKTYDKKSHGYIGIGNVISGGQYSSYIRGYKDNECGGQSWEYGHLQNYDLELIRDFVPSRIIDIVKKLASGDASVIFYCIRHYAGDKPIIHGYIVTDYDHNLLYRVTTGPTYKSYAIMDPAVQAVTIDAQAYYKSIESQFPF